MWKLDSVFLKIGQFSLLPFNCRKVGRVQLSSNFFLLLALISHPRTRFEHIFLKNTSKVEILQWSKKKTLKGFWYFLILKWRQNWKNWTQWRVYNYVERRTELLECHVPFVFFLGVITSGCYEPKRCSKFLAEITSRKCVFYFWTSVSISCKSSLKLSGVILKKRLYSSSSSNRNSCNKVVPTPSPLAYFS